MLPRLQCSSHPLLLIHVKIVSQKHPLPNKMGPNNRGGHGGYYGNCEVKHERNICSRSQNHLLEGTVPLQPPNP